MNERKRITYILLGGNIGDRVYYLSEALRELSLRVGEVLCVSSVYESEAWGFEHEQRFLNQVVKISTVLEPEELLAILQDIERQLGRKRDPEARTYQERTIDLDILYYNCEIIDTDDLTVPHKHIQNRRFTLLPLVEIAADYVHDSLGKSNGELLKICRDSGLVKRVEN